MLLEQRITIGSKLEDMTWQPFIIADPLPEMTFDLTVHTQAWRIQGERLVLNRVLYIASILRQDWLI